MSDLIQNIGRKLYSKISRPLLAPYRMVQSGTGVYPLYGIHYFATHPDLWPFYLTIFIPQLIIMLFIYLLMYILVYPLTAFISVLLTGPTGLVTAWFTVLQQSGFVAIFIVTTVLMPEIQRIAFDAVLSREYADDVVLMGKLRRIVKVPFLVKILRWIFVLNGVFVVPVIISRTIILFMIGMIPWVGPILVMLIRAPSKGLQCHARYYILKGFDQRQIRAIYRERTGDYMGFGIVAILLESIPLLTIFFMFTNTIGGALWAISIEEKQKTKHKFETIRRENLIKLSQDDDGNNGENESVESTSQSEDKQPGQTEATQEGNQESE